MQLTQGRLMKKIATLLVIFSIAFMAFSVVAQGKKTTQNAPQTGIKDRVVDVVGKLERLPNYTISNGVNGDTKDEITRRWLYIDCTFTTMPSGRNADEVRAKLNDKNGQPEFFDKLTVKYDVILKGARGETSTAPDRTILFSGSEDYYMVPRDGKPHKVFSTIPAQLLTRYRKIKPAPDVDAKEYIIVVTLVGEDGVEIGGGAALPSLKTVKNRNTEEKVAAFGTAKAAVKQIRESKSPALVALDNSVFRRGTSFEFYHASGEYELLMPPVVAFPPKDKQADANAGKADANKPADKADANKPAEKESE